MPDKNRVNSEEPQSFVVRMWREGPGRWRGKISHVQSKDSRAFTRLEESTRFMAERLSGIEMPEKQETITKNIPSLSLDPLSTRDSNSRSLIFSWLPKKRSLRLAMSAVGVCVVAAIAVLFYNPAGNPTGGMSGTAQGSGLETVLLFFLGAVVGGVLVGIYVRLTRKREGN